MQPCTRDRLQAGTHKCTRSATDECNQNVNVVKPFKVPPFALTVSGCAVGPISVDRRHLAPAHILQRRCPNRLYRRKASVEGSALRRGTGHSRAVVDLFHSEALDSLIRQALADSPNLAAAKATLREAQENLRAEAGVLLTN